MQFELTRQEKKQLTRQNIKNAAINCFEKNGVEDTLVGHISKKAGIAHGTFYVHFKDKGNLLNSLLDDFNVELLKQIRPLFLNKNLKPKQIPAIIPKLCEIILSQIEKNKSYLSIYVNRMTKSASVKELQEGINPMVVEYFGEAIFKIYAIDKLQARILMQGILALWMRVILQYVNEKKLTRKLTLEILKKTTLGILNNY